MKKLVLFMTILFTLILPLNALAVDYSISSVKIDAFLQSNGDVHVKEVHSYDFDSEFNGITREIFPKKGAEISSFLAKEDGKTLKVEKEGHLYKIHRKGKKENIEVELQYVIKNSMEKHVDMTEFYWPFFDNRNESEYGNLIITIHPPKVTANVIAFGYDTAFNRQSIEDNGVVHYNFGFVPSEENGDIRVAYDSALFPGMSVSNNKNIRDQLLLEKADIEEQAKRFAENKEKFSSFMGTTLPIVLLIFLILFALEAILAKRKRVLIEQELSGNYSIVPTQRISMPATILHTKSLSSPSVSAALLDLVRKGNVEQLSEDEFIRSNQNVEHKHEKILMNWLFDEVGTDGYFQSQHLDEYMDNKKNLEKYHPKINQWKRAVKDELNLFRVKETKPFLRGIFGLFSLLSLVAFIFSINYGILSMTFFTLILMVISILFACFYKPLSFEGLLIKEEWKQFSMNLNDFSSSDWQKITEDARMRAVIYQMGINDSNSASQNKEPWHQELSRVDDSMLSYYLFTGPILTSGFQRADQRYEQSISSDSPNSFGGGSGGGGVGGGGGGSGAF